MVLRNIVKILLLCAGAMASATALAQSSVDEMAAFIKLVAGQEETAKPEENKPQQTTSSLPVSSLDAIFNVIGSGNPVVMTPSGNGNSLGALDIITNSSQSDGALDIVMSSANTARNSTRATSPLTALEYLSNTYYQHDYYQTGSWDEAPEDFGSPKFSGIPSYDANDFYRPVWGPITSRFGYRPKFKRVHKGIDIALNTGDTVRAALPGIVARVGYDAGGYGNFIVLKHSNGVETRYGHLSLAIKSPGEQVNSGDPIGLGGNTGNSTGPHLHFETRYLGAAIDPTTVFDFSRSSMNMIAKKSQATEQVFATGFNVSKASMANKSTYVVRQGDTIKKIAALSGLSVLKLCQLNFITANETLKPGTMLKLR